MSDRDRQTSSRSSGTRCRVVEFEDLLHIAFFVVALQHLTGTRTSFDDMDVPQLTRNLIACKRNTLIIYKASSQGNKQQETNSRNTCASLWLTNLWKSPGICDAESGNFGEPTLWSSSVQIRRWQKMRHLPIIVSCLFSNNCQLLSLNESLLDVSDWFWAFGSNVINLLKQFEQT